MSKYHLKHQGPQIDALLDKAGTALQEHQDISHLAEKAEVQAKLDKKQNNIGDLAEIRRGAKLGSTSIQDISHLAVKDNVLSWLSEKVDKIPGKQLTTEDFTTLLRQKLESLQNYDDTAIRAAIAKLRSDFDTLVESDTSGAIDKFNEIIAFLDGIEDSQSLDSIIASIERQIAGKQSAITDLDDIRRGAGKGDTSVQSVYINGQLKTPDGKGIVDLGTIDPAVDTYVADFNLHDVLVGRAVTINADFVEALRSNKVIIIPYRTFVVIATAQLQTDEDSRIYISIQARINEQLIEVQFSCDTVPATVVGRIITTDLATMEEVDSKKQDKLTLTVKDNGNIVIGNIAGQSKEFMPATPSGDPRHYVYLKIPYVEYNETTGLWSYMAKYGGLTDITTDEMSNMYEIAGGGANKRDNYGRWGRYVVTYYPARTNICNSFYPDSQGYKKSDWNYAFNQNSMIEVAVLTNGEPQYREFAGYQVAGMLRNCSKLRKIIGTINFGFITTSDTSYSDMFYGCTNLEELSIKNLNRNLSLAQSSKLVLEAIIEMISACASGKTFTLTFHADVYNKCIEGGEWYSEVKSALDNASTDKNTIITIASA